MIRASLISEVVGLPCIPGVSELVTRHDGLTGNVGVAKKLLNVSDCSFAEANIILPTAADASKAVRALLKKSKLGFLFVPLSMC